MEQFKLVISQSPVSINHLYGQAGRRRYITAEGQAYKDAIGWQIKADVPRSIIESIWDSNLEIAIHFHFKDKKKRDIDNFCKATIDGLKGQAFNDDSQIVALHAFKHIDADLPRTMIEIRRAE